MTNEELAERLERLENKLDAARWNLYMMKAKGIALEAFIIEKYGDEMAPVLKDLYRAAYDRVIAELERRNPGFAERMDARQALDEQDQEQWYLPDEKGWRC